MELRVRAHLAPAAAESLSIITRQLAVTSHKAQLAELPTRDDQTLETAAHWAIGVPQLRLTQSDPGRIGHALRLHADPLTLQRPREMNGQVGVNKRVDLWIQRNGYPVASVGGYQSSLQRRWLLSQ